MLIELLLIASPGCSGLNRIDNSEHTIQREYWPTDNWRQQTIVSSDESFLFKDLSAQISGELPFVNSFVVVSRGYVVYEGYFNGIEPEDLQLIQSVAKSVTSTLIGIALDRGDISSINLTLGEVLPEYFENDQIEISPEISIRNALMMRSGLREDAVSPRLAGEFDSLEAYNNYLDTYLHFQWQFYLCTDCSFQDSCSCCNSVCSIFSFNINIIWFCFWFSGRFIFS